MKLKMFLMATMFITGAKAMQQGETIGLSSSDHFSTSKSQMTFYKVNYHRGEGLSADIPDILKERDQKSHIFEIGSVEKYSKDMDDYTDEIDLEGLHSIDHLLEKIRTSSPVSVNLVDRNISKENIEQLLPFKDYVYGISLDSNFLDSNSLETIGKLSQLRWIDLSNNLFFDKGLGFLLNLENLFHLRITHNNNISPEVISTLSGIKSLEILDIDHIDFLNTNEVVSIDLSPFSKLKKINIHESSLKQSNFTNVGNIQIIE